MAGCPKARRCGGLTIFDDSTSRLVRARAPQRLDLAAQFSPDATQLAAPALAGKRWNVALVQTQDGSTAIVPGSSTGEQYPYPTWTSSGWLVFRAKGGRLMAYRPGETGAVPLPFRWPRQARAYVAG